MIRDHFVIGYVVVKLRLTDPTDRPGGALTRHLLSRHNECYGAQLGLRPRPLCTIPSAGYNVFRQYGGGVQS